MARSRTSGRKRSKASPLSQQKVSVFDDPPRKHVLLLCCMDQRLLDEAIRFMNALNLHNRYDQVALAGGAMGVNRLPKYPPHPTAEWWTVFTTHLSAAIDVLHRPIKDVFLIDHLDCGAYKYLHPDDALALEYRQADLNGMKALHTDELQMLARKVRYYCDTQRQQAEDRRAQVLQSCTQDTECLTSAGKLQDDLVDAWTGIRVSCFLMDLRGRVTQLDVPPGQTDTLEA